jgi:uncharacterized protein (DUF983 family)
MDHDTFPPQNPFLVGLKGRCPRCGQGALFQGYLALKPACEHCELDYSFADSADGPAVFIMFIVGFLVVGTALMVELTYQPPLWLHMLLWLPLTIMLSLALLRPLKGLVIALQFTHKAEEGRFL